MTTWLCDGYANEMGFDAISNPSGYTIVGESGRSNYAPKVTVQPQNEEATIT